SYAGQERALYSQGRCHGDKPDASGLAANQGVAGIGQMPIREGTITVQDASRTVFMVAELLIHCMLP
ncbi:MAG: hypothetical protein IJT34_09005, partial [Butyrivibrio sp.]|nr:hypothetical protein [Butyrivibrio sp.]